MAMESNITIPKITIAIIYVQYVHNISLLFVVKRSSKWVHRINKSFELNRIDRS